MSSTPPFEDLFAHRKHVRALAQRLGSGTQTADDLEQEAWLAALIQPPRHADSLKGWLLRVVRNRQVNESISSRRRLEREQIVHQRRTQDDGNEPTVLETEPVEAAVNALPEHYSQVVRLHFYEGLSVRAVAQHLHIKEGTVRSRLRRALDKLRTRLDDSTDSRNAWSVAVLRIGRMLRRARVNTAAVLAPVAALSVIALCLVDRASQELHVQPVSTAASFGRTPTTMSRVDIDRSRTPTRGQIDELAEDNGSLLVSAHWSDGSPARGLGVLLRPVQPGSNGSEETLLLDGSGKASWSTLAPGEWVVASTSGSKKNVIIEAGVQKHVEWSLETPRPLTVRVTQYPDYPVRGARVYMSLPSQPDSLLLVGTSGADGQCEVAHFDSTSWVMAVCRGTGISYLCSLDHPRLQNPEQPKLQLALEASRAPLAVKVVNEQGNPVEGAHVRLGHRTRFPATRHSDGFARINPELEQLTSEDGRCTVLSKSRGQLTLSVHHASYAPLTRSVDPKERSVVVQLVPPSKLTGTVRGPNGRTIPGAEIRCMTPEVLRTLRSDDRGSFSIPNLPAGSCEMSVRWVQRDQTLVARRELVLTTGETTLWSPVLKPARRLTGHALDETGSAMSGAWVALLEPFPQDSVDSDYKVLAWSPVNASGEFLFADPSAENPNGEERALRLFASREVGTPLAGLSLSGTANETDLELRMPGAATARLTVFDSRFSNPSGTNILLTSPLTPAPLRGQQEGNAWSFRGLVPGEWTIHVWLPDATPLVVGSVDLAAGIETGFRLSPPVARGSLEVHTVDEWGHPMTPTTIELVQLETRENQRAAPSPLSLARASRSFGTRALSIEPSGIGRASMPPGEYLLSVRRGRTYVETQRVTIHTGESTVVEVAPVKGAPRSLLLKLPPQQAIRTRTLWMEFRDVQGRLCREGLWTIRNGSSEWSVNLTLPKQALTVRATLLDDGHTRVSGQSRIPAAVGPRCSDVVSVDLTERGGPSDPIGN